MSKAKLVKWGNSAGIRIPTKDLEETNTPIGTIFKITTTNKGGFLLTPVTQPQEGWLEAFNNAADAPKEQSSLESIQNEFDKDEWTW